MMASKLEERLAFVAEWYDPQAQFLREYHLFYYPSDQSVEMGNGTEIGVVVPGFSWLHSKTLESNRLANFPSDSKYDVKNRRTFLKRTKVPNLHADSLYVGAAVNLFSRQLNLKDYADQSTQQKLSKRVERTLAIIRAEAYENTGKIIDAILANKFQITKLRLLQLARREAEGFYASQRDSPSFSELVTSLEGKVTVLELMRENAVREGVDLAGPNNVQEARRTSPQSLRALYGLNGVKSGVHFSTSPEDSNRELEFFFGPNEKLFKRTAIFTNCTLAVVKPHAIQEGSLGKILDAIISEHLNIQDMQLFHLRLANGEEFLEVYKGVVPEYKALVEEITSGPMVAINITGGDQIVPAVRNFVGPADPEIAKHLRPKSIRALYGCDKVQNAIHVTDLPEDGPLEVEYFFKILSK